MMDNFSKLDRTAIMRAVRSSNNRSTELRLIEIFKKHKIKGWRRHYKLFGKPDFTFPQIRTVVFVDGCFWHGHRCRVIAPKNNADYWKHKVIKNRTRDRLVTWTLRKKGWKVIRVWECEIKVSRLSRKLKPLYNSRQEPNIEP